MSRRRSLGRGLDALIPGEDDSQPRQGVQEVGLALIKPNPYQPRSDFKQQELEELADSIREHGVLQPLIVTPGDDDQSYVLIAGERRLQAARLAELETVPVIVRQVSSQQQLELALIENLQREDLNPLEAAQGYRQLADDFNLSHADIAAKVGKSRTAVSNTLRLLNLSKPVQTALASGEISEGHARALLGLDSAQAQSAALKTILQGGLNVRQAEELVRRLSGKRTAKPDSGRTPSPEEKDLEDRLRQALGTKVNLKRGKKGGSIVLHFYSDEELNTLIELLLGMTE
ncbi:MAG: ParB/RepB/Spo0J family partition protein [Anaerolineales bacterium]